LEIIGLKYLLAVAEAGSFAAAARLLNLHTSTLSRHIFAIEEELGTTIFEREHSGVRLTSSGHTVLVYVRQTLADLDALTKVGHSGGVGKHGRVRLGVHIPPIGSTLTELLSRWHHFHPNVELLLHEFPDGVLCNAVRDRQLDAVLIAEHALGHDLVCEPICSERLLAAISCRSSLPQESVVSWAMLRRETVLVQDWPQSHVTRAFYGELFGHGTQFRAHAVGKQSLLSLVAAGFGITLAAESQARAGFPGVKFIPIVEENANINLVLAWTPQSEDPAVGRFISFMRDEARSLRSL
jgi:DNA-binding transcriptional LysR family regulator